MLRLRLLGGHLVRKEFGCGNRAAVLDASPATGRIFGTLGGGFGSGDRRLLHRVLGAEVTLVEGQDRVAGLHLIPDLHVDLGDRAGRGGTEERILGGGFNEAGGGDQAVLIARSGLIGRRLDRRLVGRTAGELQGGDRAGKGEGEEQDAFLEHKED